MSAAAVDWVLLPTLERKATSGPVAEQLPEQRQVRAAERTNWRPDTCPDREAEMELVLRRDRAASLAARGLGDEGVTHCPPRCGDPGLRFDRHQFAFKPIVKPKTLPAPQRPPATPERNLAAAVVYQALSDARSTNGELSDRAKAFLFSDEYSHGTVRRYWLGVLDIQPHAIKKLSVLSRAQIKKRLRYASNKPRGKKKA